MKKNTRYIVTLTLIAALGGLLFGYDTAVISGAEQSLQVYFMESLGLGTFAHGLTVSSALIGCIVGGLISGFLSNRIGRKNSLLVAAVLFFVSALLSAYPEFLFFTKDNQTMGLFIMFNFYRIIGGIGVGLASGLGPLYISETSPANIRGKLVTLNNLAIIFGMSFVYFVNWRIAAGQELSWIHDVGWRYMFASEAIPALLFFGLLFLVPETPRYLISKNKDQEALTILEKVNNSKEKANAIYQEIKQTVDVKNVRVFSYGKLVVIVGILLAAFQQFVGINVILYYAPRIFAEMGASSDGSMFQTVIIGIVNFIFVLIAMLLVDRVGRRLLMIVGSVGMAVGMFGVAALAYLDQMGIGALIFILIFVAFYNLSFGPLMWVLASELFPNKVRGQIMAITVVANWGSNLLISSTFPSLLEFGAGFAYTFYGIMCVLALLFVLKLVPETKGKTLEEIEKYWEDKQANSQQNKAV
ncbi:D-xylose transporter XylE [Oceanobacillus oncorhynchi subsp. incaldanensis]|uniref:D-xylose-proton symporter n=2 Tax=Oceanobacillus TaxID=182709 RepID=A0A0A1M9Y3_9BACI|nr:D-xylose transporter XylE [Oceanobacillus oncorhynchi]MDM8101083.1 D-xylose transporter XylE [Oceanobacillus oncorhynchi]GIO18950.1 D-xylose transporter XylE [Oceanobacillus oncorhynchi subsp. incaldanensis]CEI82150.1 D-xylose-proton symporter [Oceanobacillus oncorhynchi]